MRRVVVGAAAGLAISMPGALAFSASPSVAALRQPSGLSLRAPARKTPLAMARSVRTRNADCRARRIDCDSTGARYLKADR